MLFTSYFDILIHIDQTVEVYSVNLEILAAKIFSVSRIIDIFVNINFSDLYVTRWPKIRHFPQISNLSYRQFYPDRSFSS